MTRNLHARCSSFIHQVIDVTNHEIHGETVRLAVWRMTSAATRVAAGAAARPDV